MAIQSRRRFESQCRQLQVEFNEDLNLISIRTMTRINFCDKWNMKLKNTNCDSLKRQLRSFCSKSLGVN
jgi:hypothetical protein